MTDDDWWDTLPDAVRRCDLREPGAKLPLPMPPRFAEGLCDRGRPRAPPDDRDRRHDKLDLPVLATLIGTYIVVSFVHRVFTPVVGGATIGRALFGLRGVVTTTGPKPSLGALLEAWLVMRYFAVLGALGA
ncbi:hypothetical protein AB0F91_46410 [Amycolatopsis sp. NPDC023774]|uniref:hypothetical protein n=1 Tax=Amycolatopsis sp. NPDC023774 TaxID=3155015 RepID=UPI0033D075A6